MGSTRTAASHRASRPVRLQSNVVVRRRSVIPVVSLNEKSVLIMKTVIALLLAFLTAGCVATNTHHASSTTSTAIADHIVVYDFSKAVTPPAQMVMDGSINADDLWVSGRFSDAELISLGRFIKSLKDWTGPRGRVDIESWCPVYSIRRLSDADRFMRQRLIVLGLADVEVDELVQVGLKRDRWSGQSIMLRQTAGGWIVLGVGSWIV